MKVSHIIYLSEKHRGSPFGGAESHVLALVEELARRRVDVELLVLVWNPGPQISARLLALQQAGVKIRTIERDQSTWKGRLWRALKCWVTLYIVLRRRRDRIVHAHLDLIATAVVARLAGCRTVYSIHNDEPFYRTLAWRLWLRVIDRWVVAYIAITDHVRRYYLAQSGIGASKIATIRYGLNPIAEATLSREDYAIPREGFVIGFVGRLTRQKNVHILIDAVSRLPRAHCVIVGDGELREELERLAAAKPARNVTFVGTVPNAARFLPMFDVLCLPSLWEGLGLVLIEAMLQRVPIVASRAGAIPEVLGNGRYGMLFDSNDVGALARCLRLAMRNPDKMRMLATRAFARASIDFSAAQMATRTERFYRRVLQ